MKLDGLHITHPGKFGDLLWALPTIRQLGADHYGTLPTLHLPQTLKHLDPVLGTLSYLGDRIYHPEWTVEYAAPVRTLTPPEIHLSGAAIRADLAYKEWPTRNLPEYTASLASMYAVSLQPWIPRLAPVAPKIPALIPVCWTDDWIELKLGLLVELVRLFGPKFVWVIPPGSRQDLTKIGEGLRNLPRIVAGWGDLHQIVSEAPLVITDCSAIHVLAAALEDPRPVVVCEPEPARHHWIFWPGSPGAKDGDWTPQGPLGHIRPVLGNDGRPTFDTRHLADVVREIRRGGI